MTNVSTFPVAESVWQTNRAGFESHLVENDISPDKIETILGELKLYHDRIYSYEVFAFDIESIKSNTDTPYSQAQLNQIATAANKLTQEFGTHLAERLAIADTLFLHLLKQKHR